VNQGVAKHLPKHALFPRRHLKREFKKRGLQNEKGSHLGRPFKRIIPNVALSLLTAAKA
jgi:hypothetical protein